MKKIIILSGFLFCFLALDAQVLDIIKNKVKDKVVESLDKSSEKKGKDVNSENEGVIKSDEETNLSGSEKEVNDKPVQKLLSYTKYDFVPGDKVLYFEDFSQDAVGDFPALWSTNGGAEVKTLSIADGHWLHLNTINSVYCYTNLVNFPTNFILEFDMIPDEESRGSYQFTLYEESEKKELNDDLYPGIRGLHINVDDENWSTMGYSTEEAGSENFTGTSNINPVVANQVNHVIVWIQNRRVRIYHKGAKVLDMPTNLYAGTKFNRIRFSGWSSESKPFISNLKITTAAPDTRSKLLTEGKLICYGIYFDVNKDVVKPESYGALNDIAKVLKENPGVKIKIVGHTDSDGDESKNMDLSKRRALSVKTELNKTFGIDAAIMETDGKGESQPIAPNNSVANKAQNRRVEFLKL